MKATYKAQFRRLTNQELKDTLHSLKEEVIYIMKATYKAQFKRLTDKELKDTLHSLKELEETYRQKVEYTQLKRLVVETEIMSRNDKLPVGHEFKALLTRRPIYEVEIL